MADSPGAKPCKGRAASTSHQSERMGGEVNTQALFLSLPIRLAHGKRCWGQRARDAVGDSGASAQQQAAVSTRPIFVRRRSLAVNPKLSFRVKYGWNGILSHWM